jgi:hypothetical protein
MPKYVKLYEDAMDPLTGGGADLFKSYLDTKKAFIDDEHAVNDPNATEIGQMTRPNQYHYDTSAPEHVEEDTTNPPGPQQRDGEEKLANDDLSNFALPLMNNESQSPKLKRKMKKVMGEFSKGTLKTSAGKKVTDPKQAVAIGYSEAGESKNEGVQIFRFEQFVNEKYGPAQEKLEKARQKATKDMMKKDDKTSGQKKVTAIRKKTAKALVNEAFDYNNLISQEEAVAAVRDLENGGYKSGREYMLHHNDQRHLIQLINKHGLQADFVTMRKLGDFIIPIAEQTFRNIEEEEGTFIDPETSFRFIKTHVTPVMLLYAAKFGNVSQGVIEAYILQNFK